MRFKRKKVSRQRGSKTHGWGAMKKHRGAGHRGGRGNAGSGKRGDAKKPSIWNNTKYFGKHGFKVKGSVKDRAINIKYIEEHLDKLLGSKLISQQGGVYTVNLAKLGYDKLLGSGALKNKYKVIASSCSKAAEEKIKAAGGEVVLPEGKGKRAKEDLVKEGKESQNKGKHEEQPPGEAK